ncbi:MAG: DUF1987 domain-containing protein [Bacteroidetes bacterium]|nr:MAG: DUF1987 domain-containing protein [Bacteroidota bacterium]
MEKIFLQGDYIRPTVNIDPDKGLIELKGNFLCNGSETGNLNSKVISWIEEYTRHPKKHTTISLSLDAFNISASQKILQILYLLNNIYKKGYDVTAEWHYNEANDDMEEVGKDFENMVDFPFHFISHPKENKILESMY